MAIAIRYAVAAIESRRFPLGRPLRPLAEGNLGGNGAHAALTIGRRVPHVRVS